MGSVILFGSYIGLDPLTYILSGDQNRNHPLFLLAVTHPKCGILKYHSDVGWGTRLERFSFESDRFSTDVLIFSNDAALRLL